jgi:hypothetical protein
MVNIIEKLEDDKFQLKAVAALAFVGLLLAVGSVWLMSALYEPYSIYGKVWKHDQSEGEGGAGVRITNLDTGEYIEDRARWGGSRRGQWQDNLANLASGYNEGDQIKVEVTNRAPYQAVYNYTIGSERSKEIDLILNQPPVADIEGGNFSSISRVITLNGNNDSYDDDSDSLSFKWDLDNTDGLNWDNPNDTGSTTTFTLTSTVVVTLLVDDGTTFGYNQSIDSILITVVNEVPEVNQITLNKSQDTDPDESILFTCDAEDEEALQYRWDWENDGSWDTSFSSSNSSSHQYDSGSYQVKCEAYDGDLSGTEVSSTFFVNYTHIFEVHRDFTPFALLFDDTRYSNLSDLASFLDLNDNSMILFWNTTGQNYSDAYIVGFSSPGDEEDVDLEAGTTYFIYNNDVDFNFSIKGRLLGQQTLQLENGSWYYLPYLGVDKNVSSHYENQLSGLTEAILVDNNGIWFSTSYIVGFHDSTSVENFNLVTGTFVLLNMNSTNTFTWRYEI